MGLHNSHMTFKTYRKVEAQLPLLAKQAIKVYMVVTVSIILLTISKELNFNKSLLTLILTTLNLTIQELQKLGFNHRNQ